jgi:acetyl esterase/lipase
VACSAAGLALMTARSLRTTRQVDAAIAAVHGADWRARVPAPRIVPTKRPVLPQWWIPCYPRRPPEVEKVMDVPFFESGPLRLCLDVYRHRSHPTGCPVLLQVHGGGWVIGDKREQGLPLMHHLAARGWLCVTANYRLSPPGVFPDALCDLKHALAWIRRHVAEVGGDPGFVAITGESAGAHLAALVALTPNDPRYQPGFPDVDTTVQACVPIYGIYDLADRDRLWRHGGLRMIMERYFMKVTREAAPTRYDEASPLCRLGPEAPPFLVLHGSADVLAPVAGARRFVRAFREVTGRAAAYAELAGAQHAFEIFPSIRAQAAVEAVGRFLALVHAERARARDA